MELYHLAKGLAMVMCGGWTILILSMHFWLEFLKMPPAEAYTHDYRSSLEYIRQSMFVDFFVLPQPPDIRYTRD